MNGLNRSRNLAVCPPAGCSFAVWILGIFLVATGSAQTFTVLHSFTLRTESYPHTNSDGARPNSGLVVSGNTLFGTAIEGGSSTYGTVFALNIDGTGFTNLHNFSDVTINSSGDYTNSDGAYPAAGLILSGTTLYGVTSIGGTAGNGTAFKLNADGTGFTNLHTFAPLSAPYYQGGTNNDGAEPEAGLILSGNMLYGVAVYGGSSGNGAVFVLNTDGTGFTNLHSFTALSGSLSTNSDGAFPRAGLTVSGSTLYGVASIGGTAGNGTVFALNTDGTGFTNLHSFTATSGSLATNSDGARPRTGLILSDNTLYGVAMFGGIAGYGTVFALNTDGTGFTNLHTFTASGYSDGRSPSGLILAGSTLYGTASDGGGGLSGTVFGLNTDGTGFANLHSFAMSYSGGQSITNTDGSSPSGLTLSGNALYGTAGNAGDWGNGTVFSISFPPQLTISASAGNVILTWPTNFAGFDYTGYKLQSTTNLLSPLWNTNLPPPVVVNGQRTVTNPISGIRKFFRLSQ